MENYRPAVEIPTKSSGLFVQSQHTDLNLSRTDTTCRYILQTRMSDFLRIFLMTSRVSLNPVRLMLCRSFSPHSPMNIYEKGRVEKYLIKIIIHSMSQEIMIFTEYSKLVRVRNLYEDTRRQIMKSRLLSGGSSISFVGGHDKRQL